MPYSPESADIIEKLVEQILADPSVRIYGPEKFQDIRRHQTNEVRVPTGPGHACYSQFNHATAKRRMGADPGFQDFTWGASEFSDTYKMPENVPQEMITAFRKSFHDGLALYLPDETVSAYLEEFLKLPALHGPDANFQTHREYLSTGSLPRIKAMPSSGRIDMTRQSLEHEVRGGRGGCPYAGRSDMLDIRHDRRHFTQEHLLQTYEFYEANPEIWMGFALLQSGIRQFSYDLHDAMRQAHRTQEYAGSFIVTFVLNSIDISNVPLFFGGAALAKAQEEGRHDVTIDDIAAGIPAARTAGIFRSAFHSKFGARKVICPFSDTAIRWFTMNTGENPKDPGQTFIGRAITKIYQERGDNMRLDKALETIRNNMKNVIAEGDRHIIENLQSWPHAVMGVDI